MRSLLDVNVLIALHDVKHAHHHRAVGWFDTHGEAGWASCPLTQNGLLRVMSQPTYPRTQTIVELMARFGPSLDTRYHEFWPDDISLADATRFRIDRMHGHRQLTDLYLLGLAVRRGGRLVTLDARIATSAVAGASGQHLVTLLA